MKKNQPFKVREKRTQLKAQFDSNIMEYISGWKRVLQAESNEIELQQLCPHQKLQTKQQIMTDYWQGVNLILTAMKPWFYCGWCQ